MNDVIAHRKFPEKFRRPTFPEKLQPYFIQDQYRVSLDCKRNPKRFWQYVNRKTTTKTGIGDLRWKDSNGTTTVVETDKEKAEALQEFFFIGLHRRA